MIVHVARAGEIVGEFDEPTFQERIFAGEIRPEDHYWAEGFADWKSVSQYRIAAKTVRMGVAGVGPIDTFRQEALATPLSPARQGGTSTFGSHACAKSVLAFARAFGSLKCTFHNAA